MGFKDTITPELQDMMHSFVGAAYGAALNTDNPLDGAITGAANALFMSRATKMMFGKPEDLELQAKDKLRVEGRLPTKENIQLAANDIVHSKAAIPMIISAGLTAAITKDPGLTSTGIAVGMNVIENSIASSSHRSDVSEQDEQPKLLRDVLSKEAYISETKQAITEALQQEGATSEEIQTVLQSPQIESLVNKSADFEQHRKGLGISVAIVNREPLESNQSTGQNKVLRKALLISTEAANRLHEFAEHNPTLARYSLTAIQVALGGPAGYVRNMALHYTGAQEKIDGMIEAGKEWVSHHLQKDMGMNPIHADLLTQGGGFGLAIGLSTLGGASKEKILHEAKNVADKVKRIGEGSGKSLGNKNKPKDIIFNRYQSRREAMRRDGIPTSQQPTKQLKTEAGYQYEYELPTSLTKTKKRIVTDQTTDRVSGHGPHWEAGKAKIPERTDPLGRLRVGNDKVKVEYNNY